MAPGSVAINASIGLGYKVAGFPEPLFFGDCCTTIILAVIGYFSLKYTNIKG